MEKDENESRATSNEACTPIGSAKYGRLVLRALLPSYFRHHYVQSTGSMIQRGANNLVWGKWKFRFRGQLDEVCKSAGQPDSNTNGNIADLLSLANLRSGALLSQDALSRDKSTCKTVDACNSAWFMNCAFCKEDFPVFKPSDGRCHKNLQDDEDTKKYQAECAKKSNKECTCYTAICWYFSDDFAKAMDKASEVCDGYNIER